MAKSRLIGSYPVIGIRPTIWHIGADLITMCSMLRISVCMHNVDEDRIYRPAAWNAFGMDKEG